MIFDRDPIQGLVDYVNDIKPFHTKILEVNIDDLIVDNMLVTITESVHMYINISLSDGMDVTIDDSDFVFVPTHLELVDGMLVYVNDPVSNIGWGEPSWDIAGWSTEPSSFVPIVSTDGANTITLYTDVTRFLRVGQFIAILHSTNNDGVYEISNISVTGGNTELTLIDPDFVTNYTYNIVAVSIGSKTFSIQGSHTATYHPSATFYVGGSTGNDGLYHVASSFYDLALNRTIVTTVEPISSAIADGFLRHPLYNLYITTPPSFPLSTDGDLGIATVPRPFISGAMPVGTPTSDDNMTVTIGESLSITIGGFDIGGYAIGPYDESVIGQFMIDGVDTINKEFIIPGDRTLIFSPGITFAVASSTANNGTYTTVTSTYDPLSNTTTIEVVEFIPSSTPDGLILKFYV